MSKKCELTNKGPLTGYNVSHAHNKTKKRQLPNLQWKRIYLPDEDRFVRIRVSTRALRSITKHGLQVYLDKKGLRLKDIS